MKRKTKKRNPLKKQTNIQTTKKKKKKKNKEYRQTQIDKHSCKTGRRRGRKMLQHQHDANAVSCAAKKKRKTITF